MIRRLTRLDPLPVAPAGTIVDVPAALTGAPDDEVERMRAWLAEHGTHPESCRIWPSWGRRVPRCTCGLSTFLRG